MISRSIQSWLMLLPIILTFTGSFLLSAIAADLVFSPVEISGRLSNPYRGWAPLATETGYPQPHTLVYAPLLWRDLEPQRGSFDWAAFETANNFSYWRSQNVKIILNFYMDEPGTTPHRDIPDWLYNAMGADKGTAYDCSIGKGFSPNYADPYLIAEHQRVLTALGARYDGDGSVVFIEMGSLGHWGEWHAWPYNAADGGPSGVFPPLSVSDQYVSHYIAAFPTVKLHMRRAYQLAKDNNFGLYNNMFGDTASLDSEGWGWLWQIANGYYDDLEQSQPAMPDFWKAAPAGGEFANCDASTALYLNDAAIDETVRQAQVSHTTWLGPCAPVWLALGGTAQANIDRLHNSMGYRFVLQSTLHGDSAVQGGTLPVTMTWNNKGVAPFYFNWPLKLALSDTDGNLTAITATDEDIRNWLPGAKTITARVSIPAGTAPGSYKLCVAIVDPATGLPGVNLAINGKRSDGWYELDIVRIDPAFRTLTTTFSGTGAGTITVTPGDGSCRATCATSVATGTTVTLTALADQYSLFSGWSNPSCSGTANCQMIMGDDQSITATFTYDAPHQTRAGSSNYETLQAAYNDVGDNGSIKLWGVVFNEDLLCNRSITVTLQGGYNSDYSSVTGETSLKGTLTVAAGTVIVDRLTVE